MTLGSHRSANRPLDVRVTSCAGCLRTVTLVGSGLNIGDFEWFCPYQDPTCTLRNVPQVARQVRGPIQDVVGGLLNLQRP